MRPARISCAAAGLVVCALLSIDLLLPWQSVSIASFTVSRNGLHGMGFVTLLLIASLVAGFVTAVATAESPLDRASVEIVLIACSGALVATTLIHVLQAASYRTSWPWVGLALSIAAGALGVAVGLLSPVPARATGELAALASPEPSPGWYADPLRPGATRWWDGLAWGMSDAEYHATASASVEVVPRGVHQAERADQV
jgi:hypothetical protein